MKTLFKKLFPFLIGAGLLISAGTASALISLPPSTQRGDLWIATSTTQMIRVATGTVGSVLQMVNNIPTWSATSSLGVMPLSTGTTGYVTRWGSASQLTVGVLLDNGTVAGINASSSTVNFNIQGNTLLFPFKIASSTGTSMFSVTNQGIVSIQNSSNSTTAFTIKNAAGTNIFEFDTVSNIANFQGTLQLVGSIQSQASPFYLRPNNGNAGGTIVLGTFGNYDTMVGIGTSTPTATLTVGGRNGFNAFDVTSSTGVSMFKVAANGSTTIANLGTGVVCNNTVTGIYTGCSAGSGVSGGVNGFVPYFTSATALATSTFINNAVVAGVNATSSTSTFNVQGNGGTSNIATFASSSGTTVLTVDYLGNVTQTGSGGGALLVNTSTVAAVINLVGTSTYPAIPILNVATNTGVSYFTVNNNGSSTFSSLATASCDVLATAAGSLYCGTNGSGGSGNSAFLFGPGLIYNATSTDLVGIGTTAPSTTLFVQGKGGVNPFAIASSTGTNLITVDQSGNLLPNAAGSLGTNSLPWSNVNLVGVLNLADTNDLRFQIFGTTRMVLTSGGSLTVGTTTAVGRVTIIGSNTVPPLEISSSTGTSFLRVTSAGRVGIGSSTPTANLVVQGDSLTPTTPIFAVASSTGAQMFSVSADGDFSFNRPNSTYSVSQFAVKANGTSQFIVDSFGSVSFGANAGSGMNTGGVRFVNPGAVSSFGNYGASANTNMRFYVGDVSSVAGQYMKFGYGGLFADDSAMIINGIGKVVIGAYAANPGTSTTTTPQLLIQNSASTSTAPLFATASSTGAVTFTVLANGNVGVNTSTPNAKFAVVADCSGFATAVAGRCTDLAEIYSSSEPVDMGEIVSINGGEALVKSSNGEYDSRMIGIVSSNPAIVIEGSSVGLMNGADYNHNPLKPAIALAGRVPVKVSGDVKAGDFVTSSSIKGLGMKATRSGQVVGQALSDSKDGMVMVFVKPGYQIIGDITQVPTKNIYDYLLFGGGFIVLLALIFVTRRK